MCSRSILYRYGDEFELVVIGGKGVLHYYVRNTVKLVCIGHAGETERFANVDVWPFQTGFTNTHFFYQRRQNSWPL